MTAERYDVQVGLDRQLRAALRVPPKAGAGDVAVVEHELPPGRLAAPLHRHSREDEITCVLSGTMGVQEGEDVSFVDVGEVTMKRRDVWHTFWNPGPEPLRFIEIISPGAFARYFEEAAAILPDEGEPDADERERLAALHADYGFEMDPESVPRLLERHELER